MREKGFTLVELVVVVGILALILGATITVLNPAKQIAKAQLGKKESDLEQIKPALDLYYDDHKCYPQTLSFGQQFKNGSTIYMEKVPQSDDGLPYKYVTYGTCPQWYVIYAKYTTLNSAASVQCPLYRNGCHPSDDLGNHLCAYGGVVDCTVINSTSLGD